MPKSRQASRDELVAAGRKPSASPDDGCGLEALALGRRGAGAVIVAEILHGILRAMMLVPFVGEFHSNQIGLFTGSAIFLVVACVTIGWIGAIRRRELLLVGKLVALNRRGECSPQRRRNHSLGRASINLNPPAGIATTRSGMLVDFSRARAGQLFG